MKLVFLSIFLLLLLIPQIYAEPQKIKIFPTDDSFIVTDINDPTDFRNLNSRNFGDENFLKVWYDWNSTKGAEKIVSTPYLKFDLSFLNNTKINSATLKLYASSIILDAAGIAKLNLYTIDDNNWNESEITFNNQPSFDKTLIHQQMIINPQTIFAPSESWFIYSITDAVQQHVGSQLTLYIAFDKLYLDKAETISFHSKETSNAGKEPYLEIEFDPSISLKKPVNPLDDSEEISLKDNGGGCLIATATYGTELAPQVQQLREFRDNTLLQTESGSSFMKSFNEFYYSFSPAIADYERENPAFKEIVKLAITPMIASLSILNHADIDSEAEMVSYGISIIALNLGMYVAAPAVIIYQIKNRIIPKQ